MIPIAKPFLGEEEAAAAREVILSGWVTQGPKVKEFEENFARYTGAKYACAVSSCTTALHLALLSVGVKPGDVVITVSHSFIATANAIRHCGAEPVFVDIDPTSYNMDPRLLRTKLKNECSSESDGIYYQHTETLINEHSPLYSNSTKKGRVAAILAVHQMGMPCDLKRILAISEEFNIPIVEDAACAIGSEISFDNGKNSQKIGKPHGKAACFSFHPRKILTTGDGGMITSNDPELDQQFRLLRQHGMTIPDSVRHSSKEVIFEEYCVTGFNYRMTDIQAAIGIEQLKRLPEIVKRRRILAQQYIMLLKEISQVILPKATSGSQTNWQSFPILIDSEIPQKHIIQSLSDSGIATRRGIMNAHQEKPYFNLHWQLPNSMKMRDQVLLLPLYHDMADDDIIKVVKTLKEIIS